MPTRKEMERTPPSSFSHHFKQSSDFFSGYNLSLLIKHSYTTMVLNETALLALVVLDIARLFNVVSSMIVNIKKNVLELVSWSYKSL